MASAPFSCEGHDLSSISTEHCTTCFDELLGGLERVDEGWFLEDRIELVASDVEPLEVGQESNRGWQVSELVVGNIQPLEFGQESNVGW